MHDSKEAVAFLWEVIEGRRAQLGRRLPLEFRMDAAFFQHDVLRFLTARIDKLDRRPATKPRPATPRLHAGTFGLGLEPVGSADDEVVSVRLKLRLEVGSQDVVLPLWPSSAKARKQC